MNNTKTIIIAWLTMLITSPLVDIILKEIFNLEISWISYIHLGLQIIFFSLSFLIRYFKSLKSYFGLTIALTVIFIINDYLTDSVFWVTSFGGESPSFPEYILKMQIPRLAIAIVVFMGLLIFKKHPRNFFVTKGDLNADVKPVKWLGIKEGTKWKRFGPEFGLYLAGGLILFLLIAGGIPTIKSLSGALVFIPLVIVMACNNAFFEELICRASLFSVLENAIGKKHSLLMTSVLFGTGHYYGVPYGIPGVILACFLGYILGKSMLETRGFFWAFIIHIVMDILIFYSISMGTITHGGI